MTIDDLKKIMRKEGDLKLWKHNDLFCIIKRVGKFGHLCGYVGVPKNNPLYGENYEYWCDELSKWKDGEKKKAEFINSIRVHGGLTFADKCYWFELEDIWFFGFDTAHAGDLSMYMLEDKNLNEIAQKEIYRDMDYVKSETENLAEQLSSFTN